MGVAKSKRCASFREISGRYSIRLDQSLTPSNDPHPYPYPQGGGKHVQGVLLYRMQKAPDHAGAFCNPLGSAQCRIWDRKSLVRSCCGFLKNSSGVFISTICP